MAHAKPRRREAANWDAGCVGARALVGIRERARARKWCECLVFWGVVFEVDLPPHPRPLSPVGGEGGQVFSFQLPVRLVWGLSGRFGSREAAKTRSRELGCRVCGGTSTSTSTSRSTGTGLKIGGVCCGGVCGFGGWICPPPPTPLPRWGRGEPYCSFQ